MIPRGRQTHHTKKSEQRRQNFRRRQLSFTSCSARRTRPAQLPRACVKDRPQDVCKPAGVAPLQRVQYPFVFLNCQCPMLTGHRRDETRTSNTRCDHLYMPASTALSAARDAFMDQPIAAIVRQQIARAIVLDHSGLQRSDFMHLLVRDAWTGQFASRSLQRLADFK